MKTETTTNIQYSFGDCPSPHGWHNPQGLMPEQVMVLARESFGLNVDPSLVRLLTRDEVGYRDEVVDSIRTEGGFLSCEGTGIRRTYYTTTPYGERPPVTRYTFPECAPYGWSRKTGEKIPTPDGYELVPAGQPFGEEQLHVHTLGGHTYRPYTGFREPWQRDEIDAVFRKMPTPNPVMVPYDSPEDFPPELRSGGLWLTNYGWPDGYCSSVAHISPEGVSAEDRKLKTWAALLEHGYLLSADRQNWVIPAKEAK